MLASLAIRDVVLIDKLDLAFAPGLTVLTGETGAGKSILLDALGLAIGQRGDLVWSAMVPRKRASPRSSKFPSGMKHGGLRPSRAFQTTADR